MSSVTLDGQTFSLDNMKGMGHAAVLAAVGIYPAQIRFIRALDCMLTELKRAELTSFATSSASSNAIGTGAKTFTVETGKAFRAGLRLRISSRSASTTKYMIADVTSYDSSTGALVVNVLQAYGSGTLTDWDVVLMAPPAPADIQNGTYTTLSNIGGTANAITAGANPAITAYQEGQEFWVPSVSLTNSAAATLNIDGVGAVSILREDGGTLLGGELSTAGFGVKHNGSAFVLKNNANALDAKATQTIENKTIDGCDIINVPTPVNAGDAVNKDYADNLLETNDALLFIAGIDCSGNPNYPAADCGNVYKVTVAGRIGGGSGPQVYAGYQLTCSVDGSAAGTHAAVGANWYITKSSADGAVIGSASSAIGNLPKYSSSNGKEVEDSGVAISTDGAMTSNSDGKVPTEQAVVEYVAAKTTGKQTIGIPAGALTSRATKGPADGSVEMTTNKNMVISKDFDASTAEYAQFIVPMPKGWNEGTVQLQFGWSHASGSGNVVWAGRAVAISDDDAQDVAFGTAQSVTDAGGTANDLYISGLTSAITIAGTPAEGDMVMFEVYRDAANGSDTLGVDARLQFVKVIYTTNAATDD